MAFIPYPPAPEFGWYADDQPTDQATDQPTNAAVEPDSAASVLETSAADALQSVTDPAIAPTESVSDIADAPTGVTDTSGEPAATAETAGTTDASTNTGAIPAATAEPTTGADAATPAEGTPHAAEHDIEDWDSTVLSPSFTSKAPQKVYLLHNDLTGQTIVIDKSTLLGRKPSMDVPQGAKSERIEDPTRTTSRNHAAISIDTDGALWIEDYGSLNGTYIIKDGQETQVVKGTPLKLDAPATVRIGDQFFNFTEQTN
ncbi:FHA domain-containing protein [Bifidobacterium miconisargentati]|uniref:FHA domain-containing protein n=1 Tax=Bifidobacterium miconisargentati TaxID=2834437 RepID=UPI001BDD5A59|nr:FHA domain-containing protein [Bifidobacterium miconisargentati]MBW3090969.1 FHA domain-containing protein [Bifidobacterium miconisargentati]